MSIIRKLAIAATVLALAACQTSGRTYTDFAKAEPVIPQGEGRVYVYRDSAAGYMIHPSIYIDDKKVGDSVPHGYFFVDLPVGSHTIKATTEAERSITFTVSDQTKTYIKSDMEYGLLVGKIMFEQVSQSEAEKDITDLHNQKDETQPNKQQ